MQPLVYDRVTLPDLDGRVAVLIGAEVSSQLLTADNPLKVKVTPLSDIPRWQLLPVMAAIQDGDLTKAGELWERIPGAAGDGEPVDLRRVDAPRRCQEALHRSAMRPATSSACQSVLWTLLPIRHWRRWARTSSA